MAYCGKCLHLDVCKTTDSCDGHVPRCKHFMDKDEHPKLKHGRWEYGKWEQGHWVKGNERCRCSVCHRDFAVDNANIWNGCPHCLAKMDGGDEGV